MPNSFQHPSLNVVPDTGYADFFDHLLDELRVLNLRLLKELQVRKENVADQEAHTRGLFVTEEEINRVIHALNDPTRVNLQKPETEERVRLIEWGLRDVATRLAATGQLSESFPLRRLARIFGLSPFEIGVMVMALAPDVDRAYERIFAFFNDDLTRKAPSIGLALDMLCSNGKEKAFAWRFFSETAPLRAAGLIRLLDDGKEGVSLKSLYACDERIKRYLFGDLRCSIPSWISMEIHDPVPTGNVSQVDGPVANRMLDIIRKGKDGHARPVFWLYGKGEEEKRHVAQAVCRALGFALLTVDLEELLCESDHAAAVRYLFREAALQSSSLFFLKGDCISKEDGRAEALRWALMREFGRLSWMTFISAEVQWMPDEFLIGVTWYPFAFELPSYYERRRVWADLLEGAAVSAKEIDAIAGRFVLDKKRITDVVLHTKMLKNSSEVTIDAIYDTCRSRIYRKMGVYARRLIPRYRLKDIVLPDDQMHHLQEICSHLRHRHTVYFKWGFENRFALGKGLNILFSGSSGTGKTMAADIIANEFNLDLYQIDLSAIVSKYIGETEKNLSRIFKEASSGNLILFFDEADALFGKRSEVKDAHDRYANIEIDYLLQKMEDHEGIVILATNLSKNIDEAFLRRLHFSLEFPFPDENQRLLIWKKIFPPETPIEADIEFSFLAERFSLSGGNIKNVAMTAAFYAAEDESAVRMPHIILALKRELQKMGKLCVKADFGRYYAVLERAMSDG